MIVKHENDRKARIFFFQSFDKEIGRSRSYFHETANRWELLEPRRSESEVERQIAVKISRESVLFCSSVKYSTPGGAVTRSQLISLIIVVIITALSLARFSRNVRAERFRVRARVRACVWFILPWIFSRFRFSNFVARAFLFTLCHDSLTSE